jgi:hypothetical protein
MRSSAARVKPPVRQPAIETHLLKGIANQPARPVATPSTAMLTASVSSRLISGSRSLLRKMKAEPMAAMKSKSAVPPNSNAASGNQCCVRVGAAGEPLSAAALAATCSVRRYLPELPENEAHGEVVQGKRRFGMEASSSHCIRDSDGSLRRGYFITNVLLATTKVFCSRSTKPELSYANPGKKSVLM